MKQILSAVLFISFIFFSCQKEFNDRNGNKTPESNTRGPKGPKTNRPPVANAGADQVITLPSNTVNLNGGASTDPDINITSYQWTKVSGPLSFTIANTNAVQTQVTNLIEGVYQFELKVTDARGLYDLDTVQATVNSEGSSPPPCTTNCGKIVFVSDRDGNNEIYTCNPDGSNVTRLTNDPAEDAYPAWSPDGTRIAFTRNGNLGIMNADGSNVVLKTFTNDAAHPTWSPDGTRIAFDDTYDEVNYFPNIKVMDLTNDAVSQIPNTDSQGWPGPSWSPDGTKIAFSSDMRLWDIVWDIFTISPDGSGLTNLTPEIYGGYDYFNPSWSPDGAKLSVMIYPVTNYQTGIAVMNADGTGLTIIRTGLPTYNSYGKTSWSPDGARIAYAESGSIKWVAANGSAVGTIVTNGWDADWKF